MTTAAERRDLAEGGRPRFRLLPVLLVAAVSIATALAPIPLEPTAHRTLVVFVAVGGLWLTEAVPVAAAALLVPVLGVLLGIRDAKGAFAGFGDPIVFLFLGTFLLTEAAAAHGMTDRLSRAVLGSRHVSAHPDRLLWAMAALGCLLGAWMNNTATTALLLPLALSAERFGSRRFLVAVLLMTSWGPSLGGLATPVGTAPNLIGLRLIEQSTGSRPSFGEWMLLFAPLSLIATAVSAWWLHRRAGTAAPLPPPAPGSVPPPARWTQAERTLLPVFAAVVFLWVAPGLLAASVFEGAPWLALWRERVPEPIVPLAGGLLLFLLPARRGSPARILDVHVIRRLDWGTLLLFGGGLSLGGMTFESGLAQAAGGWLFEHLPVPGMFGIVLAASVMGVLASELTSNTASAAVVVPVVIALALAAGVDPLKPALAATAASSFGFMLPVSTPPNALVYATGRLTIRQMIANGAVLDVLGILLVSAWVTLLG